MTVSPANQFCPPLREVLEGYPPLPPTPSSPSNVQPNLENLWRSNNRHGSAGCFFVDVQWYALAPGSCDVERLFALVNRINRHDCRR